MDRDAWSFDGVEYGKSTPVHFRYGERVRVILHNDTMMTHPMHLHGMWSELEAPDGSFQARRHTIPVQPAQRISFLVTADALGRWAWHRSEEHTSELQSLMRLSYSVFCLKKTKNKYNNPKKKTETIKNTKMKIIINTKHSQRTTKN